MELGTDVLRSAGKNICFSGNPTSKVHCLIFRHLCNPLEAVIAQFLAFLCRPRLHKPPSCAPLVLSTERHHTGS
jgi:hypothetical protein